MENGNVFKCFCKLSDMKLPFGLLSQFIKKGEKLPKKPYKILIFRQGGIGDVIHTTPLLKFLRQFYPKAEIDYLVGNWAKDVLGENPDIDEIITFEDEIIFNKKSLELLKLAKDIRKRKYEILFNGNKSWMYNVLALAFKIPIRIGFDREGEGFCNTHNIKYQGEMHEIDYYLKLASFISKERPSMGVHVYASKKEEKRVTSLFNKLRLNKNKIVCIGPGGSSNPGDTNIVRRYPLESYLELTKYLIKDFNIILIGGKQDIPIHRKLTSRIKGKRNQIIDLAGKLNIRESYSLLRKCHLYMGHISGQLHLADASGIPIITINGPLDYRQFAPKRSKNFISHRPCYDVFARYNFSDEFQYYDDIKVSDIVKSAKNLIKRRNT